MKRNEEPRFQSEIELAAAVARWAEGEGWQVYKEVHTPEGDCDLVLCQGRVIWIVETKLRLADGLLEQAVARLGYAHYVSVATPRRSDRELSEPRREYVERYGIGLLETKHPESCRISVERHANGAATFRVGPDVNWSMVVHETLRPRLMRPRLWDPVYRYPNDRQPSPRRIRAERIAELRASLREEHKTLVAGAPGGGQLTPWKATLIDLKRLLAAKGPLPLVAIVASLDHHYRSPASARAGIRRMLAEIDAASFVLTKDGWGLAPSADVPPAFQGRASP